MYRISVLYQEAPDPDAYAAHAEACKTLPGGVFHHGPVIGSPMGAPKHAYYAEWEFPDKAAFEAAGTSSELLAIGKDAHDRGLPDHFVEFVELS
jgi:hypothetical protein